MQFLRYDRPRKRGNGNETGYYSLKGTTTNMLSKKRLRIGMLALDVTD
ncbi:MAG: hypothetical protein ACLUSP_00245 [Christensenellales bacterium]